MLEEIPIKDIHVGQRHRATSDDAVDVLAESIERIGLQTPISVYEDDDGYGLVAGLHRLLAGKKLGWPTMPAIIVDMDEIEREMWELAENLHRVDLTKEERDNHIRRYAELLTAHREKAGQNVALLHVGGRGNIGIAQEIANETGLSQRTINRVLAEEKKPKPPLTPEQQADKDFARLVNVWTESCEKAQQLFLEFLA